MRKSKTLTDLRDTKPSLKQLFIERFKFKLKMSCFVFNCSLFEEASDNRYLLAGMELSVNWFMQAVSLGSI